MRLALVAVVGAFMFTGLPPCSYATTEVGHVAVVGTTASEELHSAWAQEDEAAPLVDAGTLSRWSIYLAIMLMVGASAFLSIVRRALPGDPGLAATCRHMGLSWGLVGAALFLLASLGRLYAQAVAFLFPGDPLSLADFGTVLFNTGWGTRWFVQLGAGIAALVGFALARERVPASLSVAVLGASAAAVTLPLTGHAMAASWSWGITWPLQALHVLAGSLWLGSLLVLVLVAFGSSIGADMKTREQAVARLVAVFSPVAMVGVGGAVLLGTVLSVSYVGSWAALWQTGYGRTLLVKIALLGMTGLLGAYNWRRLLPRLGTPGSAGRLLRSARLELLVGALLLAVTAILVALPAPHV